MTAFTAAIYTDGCCLDNPGGAGGWAAVVVYDHDRVEKLSGADPSTTNNRMELTAAIEGLNALAPARLWVVTDSKYLADGFAKWLPNWKRKGWKTNAGTAVVNRDLWETLEEAVARHIEVRWRWQRGHAGQRWNELADDLANDAASELGVNEGEHDEYDPEEEFARRFG